MRYQERIYIQNSNEAVRNRDILNVNMSSDIGIFNNPLFSLSGASKIDCSGYTGTTYVVNTATTIPITFQFTANTNSFTANSATFKYEVYKYNTDAGMFYVPPMYKSDIIYYSGFSATSTTTQLIPLNKLSIDGEYLIKGYFNYNVTTEFMNKLDKKIDTLLYSKGNKYGLYNGNEDYFFRVIKEAEKPILKLTSENLIKPSGLSQITIFPDAGINEVVIPTGFYGDVVVTINGLVLAKNYDYSISGNVISLSGLTVEDDIITMICGTNGGTNNLQGDSILVPLNIISGSTDNEGSNRVYYNTTSLKYEAYTLVSPIDGYDIIVMLNGATLSNGIDYYQSITNSKRIILTGNLLFDDIITLIYFPKTSVVNGVTTSTPNIYWVLEKAPELPNGYFSLEVSKSSKFTSFIYSGNTPYVANQIGYTDGFTLSGTVGTKLYYRIKNTKNYVTMCGDIINSTAYSDIIPIIIQTNSINSY
jgi:hypothetical protein